ncbi:MAG: copper amine oxidase N-terminal domain-containing protein [Armatimonadota bacterium]
MRHLVTLLLLVALAVAPAMAGTLTLTGPGAFALQIVGTAPLLATPSGAAVSGTITLSPGESLQQGLTSTFYVDSQARFVSALARPELAVDTTQLSDGIHELRMDVSDGMQLAFSTGGIPIHVLNSSTVNLITGQAIADGNPPFVKLYRKILLREIVWFNNREADLEKHAVVQGGRVYITLTDLLRHVGGTIIWGPEKSYVLAERNSVKLRFVPGSSRVYVNGKAASLGRSTWRSDSRLFVPIRPVLALLGVETNWNRLQGRAYVSTP